MFVDPAGEGPLKQTYSEFVGRAHNFDEIVYACKKHIVDTALAGELAVLANQLDRISEQDWRVRDFTRFRLRDALKEVVACFPVYRSYVTRGGLSPRGRARHRLGRVAGEAAVAVARSARSSISCARCCSGNGRHRSASRAASASCALRCISSNSPGR